MKKNLYNHLAGNDRVDRAKFWILFAFILGVGTGLLLLTILI